MEKKKTNSVWVGIAATWFGMHCGSGFATGTQYVIYYNKYGRMAMFLPLITWALMGACFYFIFEYGRRTQIKNYSDYARSVFIPKIGWLFVLLFDLWCVFGQILGEAGILAGSGSLFRNYAGGSEVAYWIGVAVVAAIVLGMVIFGSNVLAKISTYFMYGLIAVITILGIAGLVSNWNNFCTVMKTPVLDSANGITLGAAIKSAFTYAGVQVSSFMALSGMMAALPSKKDSGKAAVGGALVNCVMLMILGLVMIANYPAINSETLPVYTALDQLGVPILKHLYSLMLLMALITTGAGCAFAIVTRFKQYPMKWFGWSEKVSSVVIGIVLLAIGIGVSKFGLVAIFSKGYGYLAKMAWPLGILPALLIVPFRLRQMDKAEAKK